MPEKEKKEKKLPSFEPGLPPHNIHNLEAAKARGLVYSPRRRVYVDEDGCPTLDRFGQPLG
jgi:hypothetical protein